MLIAESTSSAVQHVFADVGHPVPRPAASTDRPQSDIDTAIEILRHADIAADGMLTVEEAGALELVYRRYAPVVARVAAAILRNAADAEDVTQDVFANLPRSLRRYQPGNFGAWLKTVTSRTVLMRMRRQRREAEIETSLGAVTENVARFDGEIRVDSDRIRAALERLPESLRNVVELRLLRGLPHAEIGRQLGLTTNACEVRLCRAIKQLRVMIGEGLCVQ